MTAPEPGPPGRLAATGLVGITTRALAFRVASVACLLAAAVVSARQLGPSGRGVLVLLFTLTTFGAALCSCGIHISGRVHLVSPTPDVRPGSYLGLALALSVGQGIACAVLGVTVLPLAQVHLGLASVAALGLLGSSSLLQFLLVEELNAFGFITRAAMVDAAGSALQLLLLAAVAASGATTPMPFVLAVIGANGTQSAVGLLALRRGRISVRPCWRRQEWRLLLRAGRPGVAVSLAETLAFRLDRFLVGVFLLPSSVGIYAAAAAAPEILRLPVATVAQPIFYRLAARSATPADFRRTRQAFLAATAAMVLVLALTAPLAIRVVFGPPYLGAVTPLRVLLLAEFGVTLFYLDGSALAGLDRTRESAWAAMTGLALIAVGDVALIPAYGLAGAAWASVVGYSVMGAITHLCLRRSVDLDRT